MLRSKLSEEIVDYIPHMDKVDDISWWTRNNQGNFTVKFSWDNLRSRRERKEEYRVIWTKELPCKVNFLMWRVWRRRISTADVLKSMRSNIVLRCWCCETKRVQTLEHIFLTTPIDEKLWKQFSNFARIDIKDMHLY